MPHVKWMFLPLIMAAMALLPSCKSSGEKVQTETTGKVNPSGEAKVRLLLTTDEHGWLEPGRGKGGTKVGGSVSLAAHLAEERKDIKPENVLLYSIGDMWTGPYLSTLLKGEPMVKTMNALDYKGAVIGNHDFDFGQDQLTANIKNSTFPYLAANLHLSKTKDHPPWSKPYQIINVDGVKIGILGFANKKTPETTDLKNLVGLEFTDYVQGIKKYVPIMRQEGAKDIAVLIHDHPDEELSHIVLTLSKLGVRILGLGHAHRSHKEIFDPGTPENFDDDVIICNAGAYMRNYCRIDLHYKNNALLHRAVEVVHLDTDEAQQESHQAIQSLIDDAHAQIDTYAKTYLTKLENDLLRKDGELGRAVVESWLNFFPKADAAITNRGAIRQDLHRGDVRVSDVISVLPFENTLIAVHITGAELKEVLLKKESLSAGVMYSVHESEDGKKTITQLLDRVGNPIEDDKKVRVIINEFMYRGGDGFPFSRMDPNPELTAVNWRTPFIEMLKNVNSD
ncbi:MAG: hypothetical protein CMH56_15640 [Myxococcales bacterium]|nr:hypothetical protein [Myxococcales bacterium]|tara:strand:- start:846 stop:2369 length:1524 start_codon:yes stop_codon:yes gene_type:complete